MSCKYYKCSIFKIIIWNKIISLQKEMMWIKWKDMFAVISFECLCQFDTRHLWDRLIFLGIAKECHKLFSHFIIHSCFNLLNQLLKYHKDQSVCFLHSPSPRCKNTWTDAVWFKKPFLTLYPCFQWLNFPNDVYAWLLKQWN